jgi:hypothetical protein
MSKQADTTESIKARWSGVGRSARASTGAFDAADNHLGTSGGFDLFMIKAVLNGRGDELIDLAKVNLSR